MPNGLPTNVLRRNDVHSLIQLVPKSNPAIFTLIARFDSYKWQLGRAGGGNYMRMFRR